MSQIDRTNYHNQIINLFSKAWFKYDKKVTAVLRTMGFNSVKQFVDSNRKEQNYYNIVKTLKADPKKGSSGLLSTVKDVMNSNQVRSMIWIENNVQKYEMQKHGQPILEEITDYLQKYVEDLKQIPKVLDVKLSCRENSSFEGSTVLDTKNQYKLYITIRYKADITYIPKDLSKNKPYQILLANGDRYDQNAHQITQEIVIPIKDIDLNIIYDKKYPELLKALLTENVLREAFQFSGPCMFTPDRRGESSAGCLGDRTVEFNDMIKEGDLIKYVSFTAGWSTTYTAGSTHPHRQPGSLVERYGVRGYAENTPENMLIEDRCVVPTPDQFKYRHHKQQDHKYRAMCISCVMNTTCRKSRLGTGLADKTELDGKNKTIFINLLKIMAKKCHTDHSFSFDIDFNAEGLLTSIHNNGPQHVIDRSLQPFEEEIMGIYNRYKIPWTEINPIIYEHIGIEYEEN